LASRRDDLAAYLFGLPVGAKWRYELSPAGTSHYDYSWLYQKVTADDHDFINCGPADPRNRKSTSALVDEAFADETRIPGVAVRFVRAADDDPGSPPAEPRPSFYVRPPSAEKVALAQLAFLGDVTRIPAGAVERLVTAAREVCNPYITPTLSMRDELHAALQELQEARE
jgi:hypothetical protein